MFGSGMRAWHDAFVMPDCGEYKGCEQDNPQSLTLWDPRVLKWCPRRQEEALYIVQ